MTDEKETKILREVLKKVEDSKPAIITKSWFNLGLWIASVLILVVFLQWYESAGNPAILLAGGGLVGIVVGAISVMQAGEKYWRVIKGYMDAPAIRKKLDDSVT